MEMVIVRPEPARIAPRMEDTPWEVEYEGRGVARQEWRVVPWDNGNDEGMVCELIEGIAMEDDRSFDRGEEF